MVYLIALGGFAGMIALVAVVAVAGIPEADKPKVFWLGWVPALAGGIYAGVLIARALGLS